MAKNKMTVEEAERIVGRIPNTSKKGLQMVEWTLRALQEDNPSLKVNPRRFEALTVLQAQFRY